eukprot:14124330-Alexandrium_andersonii.AAC.1
MPATAPEPHRGRCAGSAILGKVPRADPGHREAGAAQRRPGSGAQGGAGGRGRQSPRGHEAPHAVSPTPPAGEGLLRRRSTPP